MVFWYEYGVVFGELSTIRTVWKICRIVLFTNTIRIVLFVVNTSRKELTLFKMRRIIKYKNDVINLLVIAKTLNNQTVAAPCPGIITLYRRRGSGTGTATTAYITAMQRT
jgi:hypothetical protein